MYSRVHIQKYEVTVCYSAWLSSSYPEIIQYHESWAVFSSNPLCRHGYRAAGFEFCHCPQQQHIYISTETRKLSNRTQKSQQTWMSSMVRVTTVNRPTNNCKHPWPDSTIVQRQVFKLNVNYMDIICIRQTNWAEMIFNKQLNSRWRFSFRLYCCSFRFRWVLDGFLQFKQKQKTVMETSCFLLNKGMKNSWIPPFDQILIKYGLKKNSHCTGKKCQKCTCAFVHVNSC